MVASLRSLLFLCLFGLSWSYSIEVKSGATDCFIVKTSAGVPITGSYEVIHPDAEMIGVTVVGPNNYKHFEKIAPYFNKGKIDEDVEASEGFFSFDSEFDGDYTMCISNGNSEVNDGLERIVAFNFRAVAMGEQDYQFVGLQSE